MRFLKKLRIAENIVFIAAFAFIVYNLVCTYGVSAWQSVKGHGFLGAIINPYLKGDYFVSFVSLIVLLNLSLVLWELFSLIVLVLKKEQSGARGAGVYKRLFNQLAVHYKSSFLALLILQLIPRLIVIHMFWAWLPYFKVLQAFMINLKWYSWLYGYICWELASWVFHYTSHRVRLFWCFHSPHHAPSEMNMTVTWVHFFAESYYSTLVRLILLTLLGVNPEMFGVIITIDSAWGPLIHVSERAVAGGRLGILQHLVVTPAHHRVHHAKNKLYIDTNFATVLPLWDWVFGTLQPLKDEVKPEYGLMRELDITNFSDMYFGELLLLYHDIKNAKSIRNKFLYLVMPPGWRPGSMQYTAAALRQEYLKGDPGLAITSRQLLINSVRSKFRSERGKSYEVKPGTG